MTPGRSRRAAVVALGAAIIASAPPARARQAFDAAAYQKAYRGVLAAYAEGRSADALAGLVDLESQVVAASGDVVGQLWKAKLAVVRELLPGGDELLLPIAVMHHDAARIYRERGRPHLATHSRTMAAELAEYYAKKVGGGESARVAARLLASLGGHLQEELMINASAEMFVRALDLDPQNRPALLGLAVAHEKRGEYEAALGLLDRLTRVDPGDREAWLRLAVNLVRAGQVEQAAAVLTDLVAEREVDWIIAVAYQELVRIRIGAGELDAARELLRQAGERLPGDPSLLVLQAYVEDRAGRWKTFDLSPELRELASGPPDPSPRTLYNRWPSHALEEARAELRASAATRLALLAQALTIPQTRAS